MRVKRAAVVLSIARSPEVANLWRGLCDSVHEPWRFFICILLICFHVLFLTALLFALGLSPFIQDRPRREADSGSSRIVKHCGEFRPQLQAVADRQQQSSAYAN